MVAQSMVGRRSYDQEVAETEWEICLLLLLLLLFTSEVTTSWHYNSIQMCKKCWIFQSTADAIMLKQKKCELKTISTSFGKLLLTGWHGWKKTQIKVEENTNTDEFRDVVCIRHGRACLRVCSSSNVSSYAKEISSQGTVRQVRLLLHTVIHATVLLTMPTFLSLFG